jgi:hypothetical protein
MTTFVRTASENRVAREPKSPTPRGLDSKAGGDEGKATGNPRLTSAAGSPLRAWSGFRHLRVDRIVPVNRHFHAAAAPSCRYTWHWVGSLLRAKQPYGELGPRVPESVRARRGNAACRPAAPVAPASATTGKAASWTRDPRPHHF